MSNNNSAKAWLAALVVRQHGEIIAGVPVSGAYTIAIKPGMRLYGDGASVVAKLQAAFKGCTFAWEV